jgi:hypothetical protein
MSNRSGRRLAVAICLVAALCLTTIANVKLAFAVQSPVKTSVFQNAPQNPPQNPGNITITGQWQYYDRDGSLVPAKTFLVGLYTTSGTWLAWSYTDSYTGNFSIGPVTNPGTKLRVKIFTYVNYTGVDGEITVALQGGDSWEDAHSYYDTTYDFGPVPDGTYPIGTLTVRSDFDQKNAWWIKDDLDDGFLYLPDRIGNYFAEWEKNWDPTLGDHFCPCQYPALCPTLGHIYLNSGDVAGAYGCDTVLHEMGHAVMWYAYDQSMPLSCPEYVISGCYNHQTQVSTSTKCAWMEGWANFWSMAVQNHTSLWGYNLENPTWGTSGWDNGDTVEGRVAGTLWDIYDSNNDGFDIYSDGFNEMWDTFSHQTDNTFAEFYDAWKLRSHNQQEFLACAYQNTIIYDTVTLEQALDTSGLTWTTGGNGNWFGEKFKFFNDGDAAQSSAITHNQETWIKTNVTGPGTVKFYWKVSSEPNYDFLRFYIDSNQQPDPISGEVDWQQKQYSISSGSHELMWKYTKDASVNAGCDCGWLDKVEWIPDNPTQKLIGADVSDSGNNPHNLGYIFLTRFTAESSGNITEIRVKSGTSGSIKVAIYTDSGGEPGALVNATTSGTPVAAGWNTVSIPSTAVTAGTNYWLAVRMDAVGAALWNPASGTMRYKGGIDFGAAWPDTAGSGYTNGAYHSLIAGWGTVSTQKLIGADSGDSGSNIHAANMLVLTRYVAEQTGNVTEIKVKANASGNVKLAIYADNSGEPGSLIVSTGSNAVVAGWNTISITSTALSKDTYYWVAVKLDADGAAMYNNTSGTMRYKTPIPFADAWPNPAGSSYTNGAFHSLITGWGTVGP